MQNFDFPQVIEGAYLKTSLKYLLKISTPGSGKSQIYIYSKKKNYENLNFEDVDYENLKY
jgi:hypothetical protein